MNDDAVAPVVAAMLILAIGVTFFAAWNAYYVPSMKAQSEITHLKDVETGFLRFSSDIDTAASLKKELRLTEPIPLGGGQFTFDAVKSGGSIRIQDEKGYLRLSIVNGTLPDQTNATVRFSNFSYQPVNNFWQDQGYEWSFGTVNVTKGFLTTPLEYSRMSDVTYGTTGTLFDMDPVSSPVNSSTCSFMDVYLVNITPDAGHTFASGNGNGMLRLESTTITRQFTNATSLTVSINPRMPEGFRNALNDSVNMRTDESRSCANIHISNPSDFVIRMDFDPIPNMTLNRKITDISLGAD